VRQLNSVKPAAGEYVLYWAQMNRRVESNHALAFAVALANELELSIFVTLRYMSFDGMRRGTDFGAYIREIE
jgi:deoxyribodipyrimidine photolyase